MTDETTTVEETSTETETSTEEGIAEETIETADEVTPSTDSVSDDGVTVDENKEAEIREGTLERENPIA